MVKAMAADTVVDMVVDTDMDAMMAGAPGVTLAGVVLAGVVPLARVVLVGAGADIPVMAGVGQKIVPCMCVLLPQAPSQPNNKKYFS